MKVYLRPRADSLLDPQANLLGSLLGIYLARRLTLHYRQQAEIRRLYQPVHIGSSGLDSLPDDSDSDDDDDEGLGGRGGAEAEMEEGRQRAEGALGLPGADESRRGTKRTARIEDNPWDDDAQSLFGVGEADDDDEEEHAGRRSR